MSKVLSEIPPLSQKDCFYIVERHKSMFTYPLHQHKEYELNFIQNGQGVRRVVGDSVEEIGEFELVLIAAENLEHTWEQGSCTSKDIREITIQFSPDLFVGNIMVKNQFDAINTMLEKAKHGLAFKTDAIMKVYMYLDTLANEQDSFMQFVKCLLILYELSKCDCKVLASSSFAHLPKSKANNRENKVKDYIASHYNEDISLPEIAAMVGMSPSSFSRFFKLRTGKTLSAYLIDIRLGHAARDLVDTSQNISEICYACGFNNLSNFNRIFKAKRGMTPKEFRALYKKNKTII